MKNKHQSLKRTFTANMLIASVLPILLLALFLLPTIDRYLMEEDKERVHTLTLSISEAIHHVLSGPVTSVQSIDSTLYKNQFIREEDINVYLEDILKNNDFFDSIMILDSKGMIIHVNSSDKTYLGLDMSNEDYYQQPLRSGKPYWSPLFYSTNKSHISVSYTLPTREGYIVGLVNVSSIAGFSQGLSLSNGSYVEILDQKGAYIAHTDMRLVKEKRTSENFRHYQDAVQTSDHEMEIEYNGIRMLAHLKQLENPNWMVAVVKPVHEITEPIRVITTFISIGLVLSCILVFVISYFTNKSWINAFLSIKNIILRMPDKRSPKSRPQRFEELQALSEAFDQAMAIISDRENRLKDILENERVISDISAHLVNENPDNAIAIIDELLERLAGHTGSAACYFILRSINSQTLTVKSYIACDNEMTSTLSELLHSHAFWHSVQANSQAGEEIAATVNNALTDGAMDLRQTYVKCIAIDDGYIVLAAAATAEAEKFVSHRDLNDRIAELLANTVEKARMYDKMKKLKNLAQNANLVKSRFLANMSHEIRTPMNGIMGMTQILELSGLDADQKESVSIIRDSSRRMMKLMNNLLFITSIDQEDVPVSENEFHLANLLSSLAREYEKEASAKGLSVYVAVDESLPEYLAGDSGKISILLGQLVDNAVKFTFEGGICIKAAPAGRPTNGVYPVSISVSDTGIGIHREDIPRLFDSFTQLDDSYTKKYQGAGLGLAICRKLADILGGKVSIDSQPEKGSTFMLTLRLKSRRPVSGSQAGQIARKVLVADDDMAGRKLLASFCEKNGYAVTCVGNGRSAVEACRHTLFDLILMDIQMPELDGVQACELIRKHYEGRHAGYYIIAVTAYAMRGEREHFLNSGFDDYLSKPVSLERLAQMIVNGQT